MIVDPITDQFGARVADVRIANLSETDFDEILSLWYRFAVLVFPRQHLRQAEHIAFTKRFGRLEKGLNQQQKPGAGAIANVDKSGNLLPKDHIGRQFNIGNSLWHTDSSYKRVAAKASILAAKIVPSSGGQTEWADMRQAYEALDDSMKSWLEDKIAVHNYRFSHAWHRGLDILSKTDLERLPPVTHPIIKIHPDTNRNVLFVGRHASHIVGEDLRTSRRLLRELTFEAAQPPRTIAHKWQVGDVAIWDNRCVLHRARGYPETEGRSMVRTTVAGDDPSNEWAE